MRMVEANKTTRFNPNSEKMFSQNKIRMFSNENHSFLLCIFSRWYWSLEYSEYVTCHTPVLIICDFFFLLCSNNLKMGVCIWRH